MALKNTFVRDLKPGTTMEDVFVVAEARRGEARNGPFWSLGLQDASGRVDAKIWSPQSQQYDAFEIGSILRVSARVDTFRDKPQLVIEYLEILRDDLSFEDRAGLVPMSDESPEFLLAELRDLLKDNLCYAPWKSLCRRVLADEEISRRLLEAPGAKSIHHAYAGGLLEHSLSVCRICLAMAEIYPNLDKEALLVAAAFHDLGKAWELSSGMTTDYTDKGKLIGHIVMGVEILEPFIKRTKNLDPDLADHLRHMILAHHGEYEWGSPKRPKTAEALVLHYADQFDSKLNTVAGFFEEDDEPGTWSPYVRSLERYLYKPTKTPTQQNNGANSKDTGQCLLPLKG